MTGKPECQALSEILGYQVTAAERDQAIGGPSASWCGRGAEVKEPRIKIKKVRLSPPAPEPLIKAKEPAAPAVPETDPTTLNAIEIN